MSGIWRGFIHRCRSAYFPNCELDRAEGNFCDFQTPHCCWIVTRFPHSENCVPERGKSSWIGENTRKKLVIPDVRRRALHQNPAAPVNGLHSIDFAEDKGAQFD